MIYKIKGMRVGFGAVVPLKNSRMGMKKYYLEPSIEIEGDEPLSKEALEETLEGLYDEIHQMIRKQVKKKIKESES